MFQRVFDDGSGRNSYVLACPRAREAVVIDPRRDVDVYVEIARALGVRIAYAFETHLHGDVATGSRELLALGTRVIAGPGASLRYAHHQAGHGERLRVGDLSILFLHTPGHTPEHISILASQPDQPVRMFTGDTLLAGGPGRPEPVDDDEGRRLADDLHDSLFGKILVLDERIEVHPGATTASALMNVVEPGGEAFTTIGRERRGSPLLQHSTRDEFVAAVLAGVEPVAASCLRMKKLNREGPPFLGLVNGYRGPAGISAGAAHTAVRAGGLVIDLREPADFAAGHPRGAINLPPGPGIGARAAGVLPHDPRVVLLATDRLQATETARQLLRVGVSRMDGFIGGGFAAWRAAGLPTSDRPSVLSV